MTGSSITSDFVSHILILLLPRIHEEHYPNLSTRSVLILLFCRSGSFFLPLCLVNKILNFDRCKFSQQNSYPLHYKAFDIVHSRLLEMANDPGTGIEEMESILVDFTAVAAVIANATYSEWQAMAMQ